MLHAITLRIVCDTARQCQPTPPRVQFFSWESSFQERIMAARHKEVAFTLGETFLCVYSTPPPHSPSVQQRVGSSVIHRVYVQP